MAQTPANMLPLQTLSESGQPPKSRVASAADAQTIVNSVIYAGRARARFTAKVKGMFDGNPPYDPVKLKQNAQSYRANVNFMEGKAMRSSALVPFYDLFAGALTYAEVKLYLENPDDAAWKSRVVTEEFDCLLKKYKNFEFNVNGVLNDFVGYGRGFIMFDNEWCWHFKRVLFSRLFVPDGTDASVEELEVFVVREKAKVDRLWRNIEHPKSVEAGWNKEAVCKAIRGAMPDERNTQTNETLAYEFVQQRMKDRDLVEGTRLPTVQVEHLFVKEFDGRVTHLIVEESPRVAEGQGSDRSKSPTPEFLFKKVGRYEHMRNALVAFFFETLDGSWNGANGLGHDIYSSIEIKNRLLNKTVDNAFLSGGITLQAVDASARQKTALVQAGDCNIISEGYNVQNAQIFARSDGLVGTNQLLDQTIASNTGVFKPRVEKPQGNPRTAKEVEIQYQNATVLSNSGVSRFYTQLDKLYEEIFRRVTKRNVMDSEKGEEAQGVLDFFTRLKKRGVERKDLEKVESVKAVRNIGNGSQFQRQQLVEGFTPFAPMLSEGGREQWMADLVASKFGQAAVGRYMPEMGKELKPSDQKAFAMLENAALKAGAPVAWTPTQNNVIHATTHLEAMASAVESLQGGADPISILAFLELAGPHVQVHLEHLATDSSRKNEHKILSQEFGRIASFADQLAAQVQQGQEEQAQRQQEMMAAEEQARSVEDGSDPQVRLKAAQAQADMKLKEQKAQHQMMLKQQASQQKLAMNDVKLAQQVKQDAIKTAAEVRRKEKEPSNAD